MPPDLQREPTPAERLYGSCWGYVSDEYRGKAGSPFDGYGWRFTPAGGAETESWPYSGELSTNLYAFTVVDTAVTPWRLDIVSRPGRDGTRVVQPGIFRFEDDTLVWVTADTWPKYRPDGVYASRPREFVTTSDNDDHLVRLKPCRYYRRVGQGADPGR